ncbi:MAG TPA: hypothetical protein VFT55_13895, partial [Planctomycetota bacterium]|nr:hypothetical protein [Planctomycetota bacterium]
MRTFVEAFLPIADCAAPQCPIRRLTMGPALPPAADTTNQALSMSRVLFLPFLCVAFASSPTAQQPQRSAQEAPGAGTLSIQQLPLRRTGTGTGVDVPVRLDGADVTLVLQPFSLRS